MKKFMLLLVTVFCLVACSNETDELNNVVTSQTTKSGEVDALGYLADGSEIYFSVYPSYLTFPGDGGTKSVQVTANIPWQAQEVSVSDRGLIPLPRPMELIYPENPTGSATLSIKLDSYYAFEPINRRVRIWSEVYNLELFCDVVQQPLTPQTECYLDYSVLYAEYYITATADRPTYQSKKFQLVNHRMLTLPSGTVLSDDRTFTMGDAIWLWGGMGSQSISLIQKLSETKAGQTYYIGLFPVDPGSDQIQ